ncbi:MAG TPA: dihydrofolate reductase family protein [Anseongella sp.]
MRKIVASVNVTIDGLMAGPNNELDWHFRHWTSEMAEATGRELAKADTILLGRVTYEAMASYWSSTVFDLSIPREDMAIAEMMNRYKKVVFSRTLIRTGWENARLAGGNTRREVALLKRPGPGGEKNMMVYGSRTLLSSLMQLDLVDEYLLWVHPVLLGEGSPLFGKQEARQFRLAGSQAFSSGVILLHYEKDIKGLQPCATGYCSGYNIHSGSPGEAPSC